VTAIIKIDYDEAQFVTVSSHDLQSFIDVSGN
jgi:hypothetical protein